MKSALQLEAEMPLMAQLGQQQKALLMQETEASLGKKVVLLIKDMGMGQYL